MLKFGTDGVRGQFGTELTIDYVSALATSVAKVLASDIVVIGRDTRESGFAIEQAVSKSLLEADVAVQLMGVAPTPAVAFIGAKNKVVTLVVTASHNPYQDNGIKIFANGGRKLSDHEQNMIEKHLAAELLARKAGGQHEPAKNRLLRNVEDCRTQYLDQYCAMLEAAVGKDSCSGLHIVVDCANGAFSDIAPRVLSRLGATVTAINVNPDGKNINRNAGATHPQDLCRKVVEFGAHIGVGFDGDGDRVIAVDNNGKIVDGDQILAICATAMKSRGVLRNDTVAVTVMSNIGFFWAMDAAGINVITTPVGDRSVLGAIEKHQLSLGGEQSGHIIFSDCATTGDGLLAAIQLAAIVRSSGKSLSQIADSSMSRFPQVLLNVGVPEAIIDLENILAAEIAQAEARLGGDGRVLVRKSGTEPMVRVMVEAKTFDLAESVATTLTSAISTRFGR